MSPRSAFLAITLAATSLGLVVHRPQDAGPSETVLGQLIIAGEFGAITLLTFFFSQGNGGIAGTVVTVGGFGAVVAAAGATLARTRRLCRLGAAGDQHVQPGRHARVEEPRGLLGQRADAHQLVQGVQIPTRTCGCSPPVENLVVRGCGHCMVTSFRLALVRGSASRLVLRGASGRTRSPQMSRWARPKKRPDLADVRPHRWAFDAEAKGCDLRSSAA
jgi:hypothetical protein